MTNRRTEKPAILAFIYVSKMVIRLTFVLVIFSLHGCAASYDCYSGGTASCKYCPPQPVQFSPVHSCECQDSIGQSYLAKLSATRQPTEANETKVDQSKSLDSGN